MLNTEERFTLRLYLILFVISLLAASAMWVHEHNKAKHLAQPGAMAQLEQQLRDKLPSYIEKTHGPGTIARALDDKWDAEQENGTSSTYQEWLPRYYADDLQTMRLRALPHPVFYPMLILLAVFFGGLILVLAFLDRQSLWRVVKRDYRMSHDAGLLAWVYLGLSALGVWGIIALHNLRMTNQLPDTWCLTWQLVIAALSILAYRIGRRQIRHYTRSLSGHIMFTLWYVLFCLMILLFAWVDPEWRERGSWLIWIVPAIHALIMVFALGINRWNLRAAWTSFQAQDRVSERYGR